MLLTLWPRMHVVQLLVQHCPAKWKPKAG